MNFGAVSAAEGKYTESLEYYQQALDIRQRIGDQAGTGYTLNSIGVIYYNLGQYSEAVNYYQQSLDIRQRIGNKAGVAQSLNNIGLVYEVQEEYDQALEYYQQALKIRRDIGEKAGEGSTLNNIAFIYNIRQQYDQSIEVYQQALAIRQEIGDRFGEATTFNNLGLAYDNLGDETQALIAYQQALAIFQEIGNPEGERSTLGSMGFVLEQQNKVELAIIFYKKSVNVTEAIRQNIQRLPTTQQQSYTETVADTYRRLADLLLQQNRVLEAQQVLDLLKVQELDEYLNNVRGNQQTAQGVELLPQEQQAYDDLISIQNQAIELGKELVELRNIQPENRSPEQQQRIIEIENIQQQIRQEFNAFINSPETQEKLQQLSQTTGGQNLDLQNLNVLQRQLRQIQPTAVLLYPLILEDRIELILVTPFSPPINRSVSINQKEFREAVFDFRFDITNQSKPISVSQKSAQKLYDILIKPIENDLIQANAKTIIYSPDGILRYIPLAALHDGNQWLIEKFNINNITAASLTNLTTPVLNEKKVLAAAFTTGNYQFEAGNRFFSFNGLAYAGIEVENIAAQIPGTTKLLDQEFNRDSTLPLLNDHTILHFATHAAFVNGQPEDSFILLGDGDRITLREIETLNLPDVALVILSACQTGVGGQVGNGGEILGLGYQMQQAGVLATIASLWIVDDQGTQVLMHEFYQALLTGDETLIESLRQAQIQLIQNLSDHSEEDFSHPYYWAAFLTIGNGLFEF
jgi:CHAT domain-containing protein/Tfp pilus assembly protein PilF